VKKNLNKTVYNSSFKENAIQQLLRPDSPGLNATASKIGIPQSTLYCWKRKYANNNGMKKQKDKTVENWTPEQKLEAVIATASMTENELGEYLRTNGLHSSDLKNFKSDFLQNSPGRGRPKLEPEVAELRKKNKMLERDVKRKDKALAEFSARVILLKKSHEIWGAPEDGE